MFPEDCFCCFSYSSCSCDYVYIFDFLVLAVYNFKVEFLSLVVALNNKDQGVNQINHQLLGETVNLIALWSADGGTCLKWYKQTKMNQLEFFIMMICIFISLSVCAGQFAPLSL